jgi:DNA-binding LacI/PurR family transcriptional regulator/biotin operon repressor
MAQDNRNGGRPSVQLAAQLREEMLAGRLAGGDFLPTERELALKYKVARKTVGRAVEMLRAEGLLVSSPRHGHRVLSRARDPARGAPLAYVRATGGGDPRNWRDLHGHMLAAMEKLAADRGWSVLAVISQGRSVAEVVAQLQSARVCGAVLDTHDPELLARIHDLGMPAVMVDSWVEGSAIDSVIQDSYLGGLQAANWLVSRGHRRIAWFGDIAKGFQSRERFGGAMAALASAGLDIPAGLRAVGDGDGDEQVARRLLDRRDRPTAVLALWRLRAVTMAQVARSLGLTLGRDLDVVGWCTEEDYATGYRPFFDGGPVPPAVTWPVREAAEAAMLRLIERRINPGIATVQIRIPTRLKMGEAGGREGTKGLRH